MDIKLLVNLTSRAWALPILAAFHDGVPGRQAALITAVGATRTAFGQSMTHLIELGLIERNPGHGHPLRPEFRMTAEGKPVARMAARIQLTPTPEEKPLLRKSWTVPILTTLQEPRHFGQIRQGLGSITDRALSQSLKAMEQQNWVSRSVENAARPPRTIYQPINAGQQIADIASGIQIGF